MTQKTTYPYFRNYPQGQTPANPRQYWRPQKTIQLSIFLNILFSILVSIIVFELVEKQVLKFKGRFAVIDTSR